MKISLLILLCLMYFFKFSNGARLLGIFAMPGNSHYILAEKLMKGFAAAGHNVTMISPYPTKGVPKNASWEDVVLEGLDEVYREKLKEINLYEDSTRSSWKRIISYQKLMLHWVNATLYHPKVRALLTPENKFDAVIMEQFLNDAHKYFAHYFQCHLILMSSMGPVSWVNNIATNPLPPSYVAHFFNNGEFSANKFWHRFFNLFDYISDNLVEYFYLRPLQNDLLQKAFPGAPTVEELNERTALIFLSSHMSLLEAVPLVPSMVEIGGYFIDPPKKLPKDLQQFLDNATEGVIYFSMGSNIKSRDMPMEKRQMLFNVFTKLKQKVLWKFEDENVTGMPDNALVKSWMPQQDILAHPNVKLFITHGGFLSTTETIYHGVPVLAIPVFADQFMNAKKAVQYGYGLMLPYHDNQNFNEETLIRLLQELLNNPIYQENAKRRSRIFHDRPIKPMANAVYWLEYVLKHDGAEHLKVAGRKLPFYQYLILDVVGVILVVIMLILFVGKVILFNKMFSDIKPPKEINKLKLG
ncbi:unnamed protein product [Ceutorhynchus assimilis]|uniref:UDP-glucuronosyltransferase n=1 Tax=Ceutorhynchus assimilis TaxID=467358 RepID=A0A9N9MRV4_9CUCU|nr:unnamed protein product [Ceutorhynchus assimilis]